jgi:uncharacterized protein (UPF0332 family)
VPDVVPSKSLLRVATATRKELEHWGEGVYLERSTGRSLEDLRARATVDRLQLSVDCRRRARRLEQLEPPMYRDAISRYYYCVYHAFRAVVFFSTPGDDSQEHRSLPGAIPADFPDVERWRNDLKQARLTRNNADYAAYPKTERAWKAECVAVSLVANTAVADARSYLRAKGCAGA